MKYLSLALLQLCALNSMAQTIDFATNAPRSGDVLTKQQIKFFSDGETGSDVIWDFPA